MKKKGVKNCSIVSLLDARCTLYTSVSGGILRESQMGFRRDRETGDHVFVLNSLINSNISREKDKTYACFINFKTAFDSVNRNRVREKLRKMGEG